MNQQNENNKVIKIIVGAVILVGTEEDELVNELDINSAKIATSFLGKYLEG